MDSWRPFEIRRVSTLNHTLNSWGPRVRQLPCLCDQPIWVRSKEWVYRIQKRQRIVKVLNLFSKGNWNFWRLGTFFPLCSIVCHLWCSHVYCTYRWFTALCRLIFFEAGSNERCALQVPLAVKVWFAIWMYRMQSTCGIFHSHPFAWVSNLYTCSTLVWCIHTNVCVCVFGTSTAYVASQLATIPALQFTHAQFTSVRIIILYHLYFNLLASLVSDLWGHWISGRTESAMLALSSWLRRRALGRDAFYISMVWK